MMSETTSATASRMKGKVCLVTGGGSGIGRATARGWRKKVPPPC